MNPAKTLMWHLSPEVMLDLVEGARPEGAVPHLRTCERCRRQLEELRETVAAARTGQEIPEPSPLFWDHLSARVREAVAADTHPPPAWVSGISWRRSALVGGVIGLDIVVGAWQMTLGRRAPDRKAQEEVSVTSQLPFAENAAGGQATTEGSFGFVADLAEGLADTLDWEVAEAGFTTRLGLVDGTVNELSSDERVELRRLLNEALAKPGA